MGPDGVVCADCKARTDDRTSHMYLTIYSSCDGSATNPCCKECGKKVLGEQCTFCANHVTDLDAHLNVLADTGVCSAIMVHEHKEAGEQAFKAITDGRHTCLALKQLTYTVSDPDWIKAKQVRITPTIAAFLKAHHPDWKYIEPTIKKASKTYHEFGKTYQASYMTPTKVSAGAKECRPCKEEKIFRAGVIPACRCRVCKPSVVLKPGFRA